MNPSRIFILRPVATSLLMAGVVLVGVVAFRQLPVSALPQVDYPTIQIQTFYPGASPDVMASAVTAPLEKQFGQVPGLTQMTSISSFGSSLVTLQFGLDLSIDIAEQEVQAAINSSGTYLPRDLPNPPIYSKTNPADAPILTLALTSNTLPLPAGGGAGGYPTGAEDFAATRRRPGQHQRRTAARRARAGESHGTRFVRHESGRSADRAGPSQRQPGERQLRRAAGRPGPSVPTISSSPADEYKPIIIAYRNGAPVRISDVATVVDSAENVKQAAWVNTTPAVILNIQRQPGTNIIGVVDSSHEGAAPTEGDSTALGERSVGLRPYHHHPRLGP